MTTQSLGPNRLIPRGWLKRLGVFFVALWVIFLVAAIASLIYQKFDGPTVQSVTAANLSLEGQNSNLSRQNTSLQTQLSDSSAKVETLQSRLQFQVSNSSAQIEKLQSRLSRAFNELNYVLDRVGSLTQQRKDAVDLLNRFVEVVPLELPPHDLIITKKLE